MSSKTQILHNVADVVGSLIVLIGGPWIYYKLNKIMNDADAVNKLQTTVFTKMNNGLDNGNLHLEVKHTYPEANDNSNTYRVVEAEIIKKTE